MTQTDLLKHVSDSFGSVRDMLAMVPTDRRYELLANYFQSAFERRERGEPLAWVNFATIPEIFWAMDLTPVYIDAVIGPAAGFSEKGITEYVDIAEAIIPDHICATNKAFLGTILDGDIPIPDLLVNAGHPCDSNIATYPVIAERFGFPYFCIDAPYWRDERGMRHIVGELQRLIAFLEDTTGRQLDFDRLHEVMEHSNRAHENVLRLNQLKMAVPAPCSGVDSASDYLLALCLAGTPEFADYCEERCRTLSDAVAGGVGAVPEECARLAWIFGAPSFDVSVFSWLEQEYGAASILLPGSMLARPVEDISSMDAVLMGLADKMVSLPMGRECGGPRENYIETVIDFCRDFKTDAAIFLNNVGCQHNWPIMKLVKEKILDELGIQTLVMEADFFDPRVASTDDIKAKIGSFLAVALG